MTKDYLIIGQGVAGSFLAWNLIKKNKSVVIVDDHHKCSSSVVSAGIINPITGKRFALTPDFDMFYAFARKVYGELEELFGEQYFVEKPILRFFRNENELGKWKRKNELGVAEKYVKCFNPPETYQPLLDDPLGSIHIDQSGLCRTVRLLDAFKDYFYKENVLVSKKLLYDDLKVGESGVDYHGDCFKRIIFCEGYQSQFNPWFQWLPFNSVKGEILRIKMEGAPLPDAVMNKGKWCAPLGENIFACGATYIWDDLDCEPTEKGKQEILDGLRAYMNQKCHVVNHQAAVRPVMKDQKPVLGMHPEIANLGIFNGLGSKGFLMAPYYAQHFSDFLTGNAPIDPDVCIDRLVMGDDNRCVE